MSDNEAITMFIEVFNCSLRNQLVLRRIEKRSLSRQASVNLGVAIETGDRSTLTSTAAS